MSGEILDDDGLGAIRAHAVSSLPSIRKFAADYSSIFVRPAPRFAQFMFFLREVGDRVGTLTFPK